MVDGSDNCPLVFNPDQLDSDADGVPNQVETTRKTWPFLSIENRSTSSADGTTRPSGSPGPAGTKPPLKAEIQP